MAQTSGNLALKPETSGRKQLSRREQSSVAEQFWKQQRAKLARYGQEQSVDTMLSRRRGGLQTAAPEETGGGEEEEGGGSSNVIEMPRRIPPAKPKPAEGAKEEVKEVAKKSFRELTGIALTWACNYCDSMEPFGTLLIAAPYMNIHFMMRYLVQKTESFRSFKIRELLTLAIVDMIITLGVLCMVITIMGAYAAIQKTGTSSFTLSIELAKFFSNPTGYLGGLLFRIF